ncbi:MAG: hypothetical protein ABI700_20860 [Chloroflexota bacterium]
MSQSIPRKNNSADNTRDQELTQAAHDQTPKLIRVGRMLLLALWQRRPHWDVESMYRRDERELTSPDPTKPTSLSGKLVADIWLLNSKL